MAVLRTCMHALLPVVVAGLFSPGVGQCVTAKIYTDRTLWFGAYRSFVVSEPFHSTGLTLPGLSVMSDAGSIGPAGGWDDELSVTQTTTFAYGPMDGFGGFWDLAGPEGGPGPGIQVILHLVRGGTFVVPQQIPSSLAGGFWGLMVPSPDGEHWQFNAFTLSVGSGCGAGCVSSDQKFHLRSLELAVPEPSTVTTLALALAALMIWRRRGAEARAAG